MRKVPFICFLTVILSLFSITLSLAAAIQRVEERLPDVSLTTPDNTEHIKYLGLSGEPGEPFRISDIDADILMIELFSMYCPYCQRLAPTVNRLYELMEQKKRPDLKLIIIGIGAKNTDLEVATFRKGFDISFPLFSDPDLSIYKTLAGAGTPTFIACKRDREGNRLILFRKSGGFGKISVFLEDLLKRSGMEE